MPKKQTEPTTPLITYLAAMPPLILVKTMEEARLIEGLHNSIKNHNQKKDGKRRLEIWNPAMGLIESSTYIDEWKTVAHPTDRDSANLHNTLMSLYQRPSTPDGDQLFVILLDMDNYIKRDAMIRRRLINIAVTAEKHPGVIRSVVMVSQTGYVPPVLEPYVRVVDFGDPSDRVLRGFLQAVEKEYSTYLKNFTLPAGRDLKAEIPDDFIAACRGFTLFELSQHIKLMTFAKGSSEVTTEMMQEARREIIKRSSLLDLFHTEESFEDVAGLDKLKERLHEVRQAWTPEGRAWGVPNCKGLLMVGVPGCGKSLIAKALSNEMGVTFVKFDPSSLFSSRVGDSESNMRRALEHIEAVAPAVVFVDEIEKGLAGIQSSSFSDSGTTARVIGTFLSWFQDHSEDIFIVATANGISNLPPELVSRFEEKYFVGMPDYNARRECFRIQLRKYWSETMGDIEDIDLDELAEVSVNLTGREIEQAICDSLRKAFVTDEQVVTTEIIKEVVMTKPPLIQTMNEEIRTLIQWVGYDPERQEGVRAKFASSESIVELETLSAVAGTTANKMESLMSEVTDVSGTGDLN